MADDKPTADKASKTPDPGAPTQPYGKKSLSAREPLVSPDGHVHLSEDDIRERDANS